MERISWRSTLAQYPSMILFLPLLAVFVAFYLPSWAQEAPGSPRPESVDDEGLFVITLAGRPVGSESFTIHSSPDEVEARGEIRLHIEQNGKTVSVQSFSDLVLDPRLRPLTYTWNQLGTQSSRLGIDFRGNLAKVRYKTINGNEDDRDFELPPDVAVLDDNVLHHYQLIVARFQAMGRGKQTFRIFVPQEALPSLLTMEDMGVPSSATGASTDSLRHLLVTTDITHLDLWVDEQQHVEKISVPGAQLEAIRKR